MGLGRSTGEVVTTRATAGATSSDKQQQKERATCNSWCISDGNVVRSRATWTWERRVGLYRFALSRLSLVQTLGSYPFLCPVYVLMYQMEIELAGDWINLFSPWQLLSVFPCLRARRQPPGRRRALAAAGSRVLGLRPPTPTPCAIVALTYVVYGMTRNRRLLSLIICTPITHQYKAYTGKIKSSCALHWRRFCCNVFGFIIHHFIFSLCFTKRTMLMRQKHALGFILCKGRLCAYLL